jgi:hypothetical protein
VPETSRRPSEWQVYIAAYNFQGASSDSSTLHNPAISLSIPRARHYKTTAVCALDDSAKGLRFGATTQGALTAAVMISSSVARNTVRGSGWAWERKSSRFLRAWPPTNPTASSR